jgi:hypothetical protein
MYVYKCSGVMTKKFRCVCHLCKKKKRMKFGALGSFMLYMHQMMKRICSIVRYDARVLYLRESISIGYILVLVPGTYLYLNLCSDIYISFFQNDVPHTYRVPVSYCHLGNTGCESPMWFHCIY